MPQFDLSLPDIATTVVVTFWYVWLFNRTGGSVLLTLIAHVTEGCVNIQGLWPAGPNADRDSVDLADCLGSARCCPVDLRSQVLAYGAGVGNRSGARPDKLISCELCPNVHAVHGMHAMYSVNIRCSMESTSC